MATEEEEFEFRARAEKEATTPKSSGYGVTEKPGITQQFLGGAKHAWDRAAAGLQSAAGSVGLPTGESLQPLVNQGSQFVKETGPASTAGQIAGDVAMSAAPALKVFKGLNAARGLKTAIAGEAATNAGYGALTADEGERGTGAALGGATSVVGQAVGPLLRSTGRGAANVLGVSTGSGGEAVRQAFKDAPGFVENLRGTAPTHEVVDQAKAGLTQMRDQMKARYANAKGGWANDTTPLSMDPIVSAADKVAAKYSFKGIPQPGADDVHGRVTAAIRDWQQNAASDPGFATVEGLDALKRHLQDIVPTSVENRTGRAYVTEVTNAVKDAITTQVPQYKTAMRDYWSSSKELDEITRSLSLGDRGTTDAALRKLQTLTKAPGHTGTRKESAELLSSKGGEDIFPAIAGQNMSSWVPSGLRAMAGFGGGLMTGNPLVTALASPRLVGETARYAGKGVNNRATQATLEALRRAAPSVVRTTSNQDGE